MNYLQTNKNILIAFSAVFVSLIVASAVSAFLNRRYKEHDFSELRRRIRTWWGMAGLFCIGILIGRIASIFFFGLLSFLALKEYFTLIPTRRADRRVLFWAYLAIPLQYWWVYIDWYGMFIIFIPVYMFLMLPMRMVLTGNTKGFLNSAGTLHWGLVTTVFSISHVALLLVLPQHTNPAASGAGLVFYLVCLTEINDVAQFVWGKTLGNRKVVPGVSPNKSYAGLIGGVGTTILLAFLMAPFLTPLSRIESLFAGVIIGLGGFIGDITVSAVKRDIGVKDSGNLLPGHGGILDRIDSLTYTAPLFLHFVRYLHY
jgi:phosphatidate cytidylyltransferase